MYVVSVCYLLLAVLAIVTRDAAIAANRESDTNLTDAEVVAAVSGLVLIAVVIGLVVAAAGIVAAINLTRGRGWARVMATVVVGTALLFSLLGARGSGGLAIALHALVIISGVAALVLLYRRASNAFFARPRLP